MVHRCMGLTFRRFQLLEKWCNGDWKQVLTASLSDLHQSGIDRKGIEKWFLQKSSTTPEKEWDLLEHCNASVLVYGEPGYPILLGRLHTPPVLLFVRGELRPEDVPGLAVVGSRKISEYGTRALNHLLPPCIQSDICIISGLALGVDIYAHSLAHKHKGRTLCVLGGGIHQVSPRSNQRFAEQLLADKQGAILSEYLPGVEPRPEYFPVRNRIIAGLSKSIIIIEAAKNSGSLITARLANDQGKDVYAVPGDIFMSHSKGTNHLIEGGEAQLILDSEMILSSFGKQKQGRQIQTKSLEGVELEVMRMFLEKDKIEVNEILRCVDITDREILSVLSLLEMKGFITHIGSQLYGVT